MTIVGALVLVGWALDVTVLKSVTPGLLTMKPNTAVAFVLGGGALLIHSCDGERSKLLSALGRAGAAVVALIGALTMSEHVFGSDLRIDCLLFADAPTIADPSEAGRMCPETALNLIFAGSAIMLLDARPRVAQILALAVALIAGITLLGYVFDAPALYAFAPVSSVAVHTAGATFALGLGVLGARPDQGILVPLTSDTAGGRVARSLLPAVIVGPILLGWLELAGTRWGHFGVAMTTALSAVLCMIFFGAMIWWSAGHSRRVELARSRSEECLAERTDELEALLAHAPIGFAFFDRQGRQRHVNAPFAELLGVPREELLGKTLAERVPARALEIERHLAEVFATGEAIRDVEMDRATDLASEGRSWLASFYPVLSPAGDIRCVGAVATDISAQKRAEKQLRASEASMRRLWESNLLGVMKTDAEGNVTDANDAVLQLIGYTREELQAGRVRWDEMTPPEYLHLDRQGIAESIHRGMCTPYEKVYIRKDGRRVPILIGYARVDGPGLQYICFLLDLTERAVLLESERAARGEAERASRLKDEFVATVSHELRTPLNAIQGWAHLLKRPAADPAQLEKGLGVIERNTRHITQIVSDLLDTSRIVSGKLHLEIAPIDLSAVIDATIDEMRIEALAKGITLSAKLGAIDGEVHADPNRIRQIVQNLVSNALKFTPCGGRVDVMLEGAEHHVTLRVRDTGQGFDAAFAPFIFDRFRQADASTVRRHGGLGLGLAIVKHVVELHGGTIRAASDGPGKGAEITLTLPATPARAHLGPSAAPVAATDLRGIRVLVVDDQPDALEIAQRILEEHGASVSVASSGHEALDVLSAQRPDVLVSDISMPGMDGYELVRSFRANREPRARTLPAIALTAFARPEDKDRAHAAGFQAHVTKPIEPVALISAVASLHAAAAEPASLGSLFGLA
ncbi:two-component hybrid sensor and regulator [Minicystis rosea]|nr:two-component hybrid sensor and regulator [Minicystis rosea]